MARPKKDGRRATGVYGKKGRLYLAVSTISVDHGEKKYKQEWIATGMTDSPENVSKAIEMRIKLMKKKSSMRIDRNITLSAFVEIVLERKKREIADTTYAAYLYRGEVIRDFFGKQIKVKDLEERLVEKFLDSLLTANDMSLRTVKDIRSFLGLVVEESIREDILFDNPVKAVKINKNLVSKKGRRHLSDEEFFSYEEAQVFLDSVRTHELYQLFYTALYFALRREEVLGLRWSSINYRTKTLEINHTVTKGTGINRLDSTKTEASNRQYPLSDEQITMFRQLKQAEDNNRVLFSNSYVENDYIFKHADGSLYYPDYPSKCFKKLLKRMKDLPQAVTLHGLRVSCVSILVHEGFDVKAIQKWVGHKDIDTTLRIYAMVKDKEAKKEISQGLSKLIQLSPSE